MTDQPDQEMPGVFLEFTDPWDRGVIQGRALRPFTQDEGVLRTTWYLVRSEGTEDQPLPATSAWSILAAVIQGRQERRIND